MNLLQYTPHRKNHVRTSIVTTQIQTQPNAESQNQKSIKQTLYTQHIYTRLTDNDKRTHSHYK